MTMKDVTRSICLLRKVSPIAADKLEELWLEGMPTATVSFIVRKVLEAQTRCRHGVLGSCQACTDREFWLR